MNVKHDTHIKKKYLNKCESCTCPIHMNRCILTSMGNLLHNENIIMFDKKQHYIY